MNAINLTQDAKEPGRHLADLKFNRVLVPVDFSVSTLETLRYAKALTEQFAAVVDVLHVAEFKSVRDRAATPALGFLRTLNEGIQQELKKVVEVVWPNEARGQISVRVCQGRADEVILREAASTKASLIIMGTRDRSWLSRLLRRHTVKHVVQNSPCPVMLFRVGQAGLGANRLQSSSSQMPFLFRWHKGERLELTLQTAQ